MLFKPEHVEPILSGRKTQTRRIWKRRMVKSGGVYWAQTKLFDKESRFARIWCCSVHEERLSDITEQDAIEEGYGSVADYLDALNRIHGSIISPDEIVTVVKFKVYEGEMKK